MSIKFPYSRPEMTAADVAAATRVLESQFLTQGPEVSGFEAALAARLGCREVVVCSNGTAALHLAYMAAGLGPDRGLLTTPVTFLATANAARMCGAPVAFADVDPATGNIDVGAVERALTNAGSRIGVIAPVHLAGRPCDMPALRALADRHGCLLVEDACHALGAVYGDPADGAVPVGACAHSDMAVFSFHAIKHVAMGEGGAVTTNDPALARTMRLLRSHGLDRDPESWTDPPEPDAPWYYEMRTLGWNYRATDLQCAIGTSQLARLDDSLRERRRIAAAYDRHLAGLNHVRPPVPPTDPAAHAWHLYAVAIDFAAVGKTRGTVMRELAARGIGSQVHYIPLHHQPYYRDVGAAVLDGAEAYYAQTLSIPMYPALSDDDVAEIAAGLRSVLGA